MAEELPALVSTFKVVGRLVKGVADSNDPGLQPEIIPVADAIVTFTPSLSPPVFRVPGATPPITVYQETIMAKTDENGYLVGPNDAVQGVVLIYGGDPDIVPTGWTWNVTITPGGNFPAKNFTIMGSPGGVFDLSTLEPVPPSLGVEIEKWEIVRSEVIATVAPSSDWSGAVDLALAESRSKYLKRRLTGDTTLTLAAGETDKAYSCTLEITQDSVGNRKLSLPNVATPYSIPIPLSGKAGSVSIVRLEWNGSRWSAYLAGSEMGVPL